MLPPGLNVSAQLHELMLLKNGDRLREHACFHVSSCGLLSSVWTASPSFPTSSLQQSVSSWPKFSRGIALCLAISFLPFTWSNFPLSQLHSQPLGTNPVQFSSVTNPVQFSCDRIFVTPWTAECQAFLSTTNSHSLPKICPLSW